MPALPTIAKIRELRLRVAAPNDNARRPLTRKAPYAPALREMWFAEVALAATAPADALALAAFIESLDGRVDVLTFPLAGGVFGAAHAVAAGTLSGAVAAGANRVKVLKSGAAVLEPGTLLGIGDPNTAAYQMVEVTGGGAASVAQVVHVAPRIRRAFASGTAVAIGSVTARMRLDSDAHNVAADVVSGTGTLSLIEAV